MFRYDGNLVQIRDAVDKANDTTVRKKLKAAIEGATFDMSTASSDYLAKEFMNFTDEIMAIRSRVITIRTYRKKFSRAIAYFTHNRPHDININTAKLNRTTGSIVGTLYHEAAHMFDHSDKTHSFGHGSNSKDGKQNTFPYKVGALVQAIVDDSTPDYNNTENHDIATKTTLWETIKRFFRGLF